jgi:hypothetical protein
MTTKKTKTKPDDLKLFDRRPGEPVDSIHVCFHAICTMAYAVLLHVLLLFKAPDFYNGVRLAHPLLSFVALCVPAVLIQLSLWRMFRKVARV